MYDHEYPPADWTAAGIAEALSDGGSPGIPAHADKGTWETLRSDPLTAPAVESILETAADTREQPVPELPASLFLEYERTGNRANYHAVEERRWRRLSTFALAECFEREGRYLDPVLDYAWSICEQSSWLVSAHVEGGLPRPNPPESQEIDLHASMAARTLAELDYLLGEQLHPALRERIRHEVDRRVLTPYLQREDFSWLQPPVNNHNAVNNAGAAMAALYLEDADRAAEIVQKAADSLEAYLGSFDRDGCTAEGFGYWSYGIMHYVLLSSLLEAMTAGAYDLCSPPVLERIARYPLRVGLSPGTYVPYSDECADKPRPPYPLCWLGERFDLPALAAQGRTEFSEHWEYFMFPSTLRNLLWSRSAPERVTESPPKRDFLSGHQWWFARGTPGDPDGLVVAAKGGHNDESHNHNDCGTFVVHWRGESLLTDLGRHSYESGYFGEDRYGYLATRSLGHSVPYVNGCEQEPGGEYAAAVRDRTAGEDRETVTLDIGGCYPDRAGLETLERRVVLDRAAETVRVVDDPSFTPDAPGREFESVLISYESIAKRGGDLLVGSDGTATITPDGPADIRVERLEDAIDVSFTRDPEPKLRDVWRARISPGRADLGLTVDPGM